MSMRVSTNTARKASRQLPQVFSGSAIGTANPNSLHSGVPMVTDAMGMSDSAGVISFFHDSGAARTITAFYWDQLLNNANTAQGWVELGPVSTIYSEIVNPFAQGAFTCPESVPIFLMADAAVANCYMGGAHKHPLQSSADLQGF